MPGRERFLPPSFKHNTMYFATKVPASVSHPPCVRNENGNRDHEPGPIERQGDNLVQPCVNCDVPLSNRSEPLDD